MPPSVYDRLTDLGIVLPKLSAPLANYAPFVLAGNWLHISGQLPMSADGDMTRGHLGRDVSIEEGQRAARTCALNILAQANAALEGNLDRVLRVVKLTGFVASMQDFTEHPKVINGASNFIVEVFGDRGLHARAAVGVSSLPLGAAVEIDALLEVKT